MSPSKHVLVYSDSLTWHSASGIAPLITAIRTAPIEPGMAGPADSRRRTPAGVHLDADQHRTLGLALAPVVAALL